MLKYQIDSFEQKNDEEVIILIKGTKHSIKEKDKILLQTRIGTVSRSILAVEKLYGLSDKNKEMGVLALLTKLDKGIHYSTTRDLITMNSTEIMIEHSLKGR